MQQPSKDFLKDQLALAAEEIIRLREMVNAYPQFIEFPNAPYRPVWQYFAAVGAGAFIGWLLR